MTDDLLNEYKEVKECIINGEIYSVRDNGSILRHSRKVGRKRKDDNKWTFGNTNKSNPYLHLSNVRVHRIVATAFHGEPEDPKFVVDHIDTNCRNNRPKNLRWLSRLENSLKNPITRKKIEYLCGSIEAFLENPSILHNLKLDPNYSWMRAVSKEEAHNCKLRMHIWANKEHNYKKEVTNKKYFEKNIYKPIKKWEVFGRETGLDLSRTPWCAQYMWKAPTSFPLAPESIDENPISSYLRNISKGTIFSESEYPDLCPTLYVDDFVPIDRYHFIVICKTNSDLYHIVGVQFDKKSNHFIHFILESNLVNIETNTFKNIHMNIKKWFSLAQKSLYNN